MRTKVEILDDARCDIQTNEHREDSALWLEVRKLEVFIDIRDVLKKELKRIDTTETRFIKTP